MAHDELPQDKRMSWFEQRIATCLKMRAADLKKFLENEENRAAFTEFMDGYEPKKLYVYPLPSGIYVARTEAPEELKKKGMYFFRTRKDKIENENNLRANVQFGDLCPDSLGSLDLLTKNLFSRLLKTRGSGNQAIPAVFRAALNEKTDSFASQILVATGLSHGKTLLPIPEIKLPRRVEDGPQDKELVFVIENSIAQWTIQIRQAIAASPEDLMNESMSLAAAALAAAAADQSKHPVGSKASGAAFDKDDLHPAVAAAGAIASAPHGAVIKKPVHPGPLDEIAFWASKADNLDYLEQQLFSVDIAKMTIIIKKSGSSYYPAFASLIDEVRIAAAEAHENHRFLKPLAPEFEVLASTDSNRPGFLTLVPKFRRLFHFMTVIWKNSTTYNTARRMAILIREVANDVIASARNYVQDNASDILSSDPALSAKSVASLSDVLNICGQFKAIYFQFKSKMNGSSNPWTFQNVSLFQRLDAFLERCHDVVDILETIKLFISMEAMRIGGAIGVDLTTKLDKIRADFVAAHQTLQNSGVDFLDIDDGYFDGQFAEFIRVVKDLELQLGAIMASAIDESKSLPGIFKVVDTFEGFTDRITLSHEWSRKQTNVLKAYHNDLLVVQELFNKHKEDVAGGGVFPNLPPTSTSLIWSQALIDRIDDPTGGGRVMELYRQELANADSRDTAGSNARKARLANLAAETEALRNSLLSSIRAFRHTAYGQWASAVEAISVEKLQLNLLTRGGSDGQNLIVNFDPDLIKALREIHYLNKINESEDSSFPIPQKAVELGNKREILRSYVLRLDYISTTYNNIMENTRKEDEKPLLRNELDLFENIISRGLRELTWMSGQNVEEFVCAAVESIRDIDQAVSAMHGNVEAMKQKIADFTTSDTLLPFHSKKGDKIQPENEARKRLDEHIKNRRATMKNKEQQIKKLLEETLTSINSLKRKCGFSEVQNSSSAWISYVEYVNHELANALIDSVKQSLRALRDQLDPMWIEDNEGIPLMEIRLDLSRPTGKNLDDRRTIRFIPNLDATDLLIQNNHNNATTLTATKAGSAADQLTLEQYLNDFAHHIVDSVCSVTRLESIDASHNYMSYVDNSGEIKKLFAQITDLIKGNNEQCHQYLSTFASFAPMYESDMRVEFKKFLNKNNNTSAGNSPTGDQQQDDAAPTMDEVGENEGGDYFGLPLEEFHNAISSYERTQDDISGIEERRIIAFVRVDAKPIRAALSDLCRRWKEQYSGYLTKKIQADVDALDKFIDHADDGLNMEVLDGNLESLKAVMRHIRDCRKRNLLVMGVEDADPNEPHRQRGMFPPIHEALLMLKSHPLSEAEQATVEQLDELRKPAPDRWINLNKKSLNVRAQNSLVQDREAEKIKDQVSDFEHDISRTAEEFRRHQLFGYNVPLDDVYDLIDAQAAQFTKIELEGQALRDLQELFDLTPAEFKELRECKHELALLKQGWDMVVHIKLTFQDWLKSTFKMIDVDSFLDEIKRLLKQLKNQPHKLRGWDVYKGLVEDVNNMNTALPLCSELRSDAMRERHWKLLLDTTHTTGNIEPDDPDFTLERLISLGLHHYAEDVSNIVEKANKEQFIERALTKIIDIWEKLEVSYSYHDVLATHLLGSVEDIIEQLENDNNVLQSLLSNRFVEYFLERVLLWQRRLGLVESSITKWVDIQRQWQNLHPIFTGPADIKGSLAEEVRTFNAADELFRAIMQKANDKKNVIHLICSDIIKKELNKDQELEEMLDYLQRSLGECEKGLNRFLSRKREIFARFFFVSSADLIDILSKGNDPQAVMVHMSKIIDSVDTFVFDKNPNGNPNPKDAWQMISIQGEEVKLIADYSCDCAVEDWLRGCVQIMKDTIKQAIYDAMTSYHESKRNDWIHNHCGQAVIVARRIVFTLDVHDAFANMETGSGEAMREFQSQQLLLLNLFINEVGPQSQLTKNKREMLKHLITIEVHNRDIVSMLVADKNADNADCFTWTNQLRYYWRNEAGHGKSGGTAKGDSVVQICDAEFINGYEYIGLCGCLVITKLTDRCYITLSQALKIKLGGAPAGPAGTGKTETTKDLARNLGIACYVFNCSDQMSYKTLGQIFQGLAMSGCWGCFDEFNRISIEVLSVVATQVNSILNALRVLATNPHKNKFRFMGIGDEIPIVPSVGMFITMNPGYAGRTELPENIKALFRPCAMVVPDLQNICEIMLAAEGFVDAKELALKFVTLYRLNKELLSPQDHYDWGLRAVKSVLYIAGGLRREDPDLSEKSVLMRALRDTNLAKLSKDDVYVFMGLIQALFPRLDIPKKERPQLSAAITEACKEEGNVTGENDIFVLKCLQYEELLHVRHSVFILGPAGCGKTSAWRCLQRSLAKLGDKCSAMCLNPKAVTSDEMYGYFFQRVEWRDGILSNIFRNYAAESKTKKNSKWIVLDGIIDAEWIESMNTVMDDNKMLTLVSNDRIPLTSSMRMIFEISHLKNASPATVSRAGIIFINGSDLGWTAFKEKWVATRKDDKESIMLDTFFDKYLPITFDFYHRSLKPIVQVVDINIVQSITYMIEGIFAATKLQLNKYSNQSEILEKIFVFCVVWAFGGTLPGPDGRIDMRQSFSNWWRKEFPTMKMAETGTVFDFFLDMTDFDWKPWADLVQPYKYDPEQQLSNVTVATADTVRMRYLMSLFIDNGKPVVLCGTAGTGKTALLRSKLMELDNNQVIFRTLSFNSRTDSTAIQNFLEQNIEKRSGRTFGPANRKKLICFFDDFNMQTPDKYGTQTSMAFIQQHLSYGFWYDRVKAGPPKEVVDVRYCAALNPKSGSFTILDRVGRLCGWLATVMPDSADLTKIYGQILEQYLTGSKFSRDCYTTAARAITKGAIDLHQSMVKNFLPTAIKFHYQWNMRELFNIFQGMCKAHANFHDSPLALGRMFVHEAIRTFRDRMPDVADMEKFDILLKEAVRAVPDMNADEIFKESEMFAPILTTPEGEEGIYAETTLVHATTFFQSKLEEYNMTYALMDLVLFKEAVEHVCRIARVIANPRGNALLIGVGGSGKQSLARLAAYMMGQEPYQITVTARYGIDDFRQNMQDLYRRTGVKGQYFTLIITDSQIVSMDMLVYLNDMLSSGNVPELFIGDDRDNVINSLIQEVKLTGENDYSNPDVIWSYFINKVRTFFHIVLCFSPKSPTFAPWCRQFPALANNTVIDWFHDWPENALHSVSVRNLQDVDFGADQATLVENISEFMSKCQEDVVREAEEYYRVEKRRCYATPKSFLELIKLYKDKLKKKRDALEDKTQRLVRGINTIKEAGAQVSALQEVLKTEQVEVEDARQKTQQLMEYVGGEKAKVQEQNEIGEIEEAKTNKIVVEVEGFTAECARDLSNARPLVEKALSALNTLDKNSLSELKSMGSPPNAVSNVVAAVKCLTSNPAHIPALRSRTWNDNKKAMGTNVAGWLKELQTFDVDNIPQPCIDAIQMYINSAEFDPQVMASQSKAASGLCAWVIGINEYHKVRCDVRPKEIKLAESQDRLATSKTQLKKVQDKVANLKAALDILIKQYNEAVDSLNAIEAKAKKTRDKADLAQRLVSGLASENTRWGKTIDELKKQSALLTGDTLLAAAFVSFVGPFSKPFREKIIDKLWSPRIKKLGIPITPNLDVVMQVLTDEASVAQWNNDSLPTDRVSTENGAITVNSIRWPLMIDPQLQGVKWIRNREEKRGLKVIQASGDKWTLVLQSCIEEGLPCMIESLGEHIDPVLDNVLGRNTFKKGGKTLVRIGANDVAWNEKFQLYLQTRLPNPHFKPEINAQTTLINFMVTEVGLEDQLLAVVVNHERPELEERRSALIRSMNTMTIELRECEDGLLYELSNAKGDILENVALVENLETTKRKAAEINKSMIQAVETGKSITHSRSTYQSVALRGALLFFQIDNLAKIDHMYQYSLEAFMVVFNRALGRAARPEEPKDVAKRVELVLASVTETLYAYVSRGLFERHKLIFAALLTFTILTRRGEIDTVQLDFLLRGTRKLTGDWPENVRDFIAEPNWQAVLALADVPGATPGYELLPHELDHSRWRAWMELEKPEEERGLPLDYKNLTQFQRLLVLRCLRPDRLTAALESFVAESMGKFFITDQAVDITVSFKDSSPITPLFFILSPGVDPVRAIEKLGEKIGITYESDGKKLYNVSLGQGMEDAAMEALEQCFEHGGWALLSNIHLVEAFVKNLEKKFEYYSEVYAKMAQIAKRKAELRAHRRAIRRQHAADARAAANANGEVDENGNPLPHNDDEHNQNHAAGENHADNADGGEHTEGQANGANNNANGASEAQPGEQREDGEDMEASGDNEYGQSHSHRHDDEDEDEDDDALDEELEMSELHMEDKPGHADFRVFLTAEPSRMIPIGVLQRSIKLTSEPPTGIQANVLRALANFSSEPWEQNMPKPNEYRSIMFAMCWFHAVVVERKKFGAQGWNRVYPFNIGDLTTCLQVTSNFIEERPKVPWEDLRYVFGEIMYGGHITDDWDRVLCMAYLQSYIVPECLDGLELTPGFVNPAPVSYQEYVHLVQSDSFPAESPVLYGLHPNAEINFRTTQADVLFRTINELQPKENAAVGAMSREDAIKVKVQEILDHLPELHNMIELTERLEEDRTPQQHVFYQECERMNFLTARVRETLSELKLGLEGALSISPAMQLLADELFMEKVPEVWQRVSFMSLRPLPSWFDNFNTRNAQLVDWVPEMITPKVTMLSYFFNPMSFLTAIMQTTSINFNLELDKMTLACDVLKKAPDQVDTAAREGAHVAGLVMEGARWDIQSSSIEDSRMKELYPKMPVMTIRAVQNKQERQDMYECPIYKTQQRGPGFVTSLFLKSKQPSKKWTIAGVGMLLDVVE